jgi:serine/threonine protein kinase
VNVATEWLRSGETASLDGIDLVPLPYGDGTSLPVSIARGQATAYVLADRQNRGWILKKFLPGRDPELAYVRAIRGLVPLEGGFESGSQRRVLTPQGVGRGFGTPEFNEWIDKTILMPRVSGMDWLALGDAIRSGTITLSDDARFALCRNLVRRVRALDNRGLAHRDLSITNVFIDPATWDVHLIDWDALYHGTLAFPANTNVGTPGYIAPFVNTAAGEDARKNWCEFADRFAMALLCAEFLVLGRDSDSTHDGGLFEQSDLYSRRGPTLRKVRAGLIFRYATISRLVDRAFEAKTFAACPSPDEWLAAPPLAKAIEPPLDPGRQSVIAILDSQLARVSQPPAQVPPPPPAPPFPEIDFSAVIRNLLTHGRASAPPANGEPAEDEKEAGDDV